MRDRAILYPIVYHTYRKYTPIGLSIHRNAVFLAETRLLFIGLTGGFDWHGRRRVRVKILKILFAWKFKLAVTFFAARPPRPLENTNRVRPHPFPHSLYKASRITSIRYRASGSPARDFETRVFENGTVNISTWTSNREPRPPGILSQDNCSPLEATSNTRA